MNTTDLIFEYKGPVAVTQRYWVHGELTHKARDVTVHSTRPYGEYELGLLFSYVESVFRTRVEYSIVPDGMRYCEVFARDGTRLFDSRDLIPCEPPPVRKLAAIRGPDDGYGRRAHPRRFRDQRKQ